MDAWAEWWLAVERLLPGILFLQLDVQWLPIMIAWNVRQWLPNLKVRAVAKHGFPRLWNSNTLNERSAPCEPLFAGAGSNRSNQLNILQADVAALVIGELMIAFGTFHDAVVLAEALFRSVFGIDFWHVEISVVRRLTIQLP